MVDLTCRSPGSGRSGYSIGELFKNKIGYRRLSQPIDLLFDLLFEIGDQSDRKNSETVIPKPSHSFSMVVTMLNGIKIGATPKGYS